MSKRTILNCICLALIIAIVAVVIVGIVGSAEIVTGTFDDGLGDINLDSISLKDSDVEVKFSDVLITNQKESTELIVYEIDGSVSTELTDKLIDFIDLEILKKTKTISYSAHAAFIVDLAKLNKYSIVQDNKNNTVTIYIPHPMLESYGIDPEKIEIAATKEGLFNRGEIKLTVSDYKDLESTILKKINEKFDTADNVRRADASALKMVRAVYEPVVQAIDSRYNVIVEFE